VRTEPKWADVQNSANILIWLLVISIVGLGGWIADALK